MPSFNFPIKSFKKDEREKRVLFGVIEFYLATGRPVGSQSLKEQGFEDLSSATIRNYFAKLEEQGFLVQQHSSGGRVPTDLAFQLYAKTYSKVPQTQFLEEPEFNQLKTEATQQISAYLHKAATILSSLTHSAVFLTAPRFDHDCIADIKLVIVDQTRCVAILLTQFGFIHTEQLYLEQKIGVISIKKIESYFTAKIKATDQTQLLNEAELELAQRLYKEILMRYVVFYTHFSQQEITRIGFSQLLSYPEFAYAQTLANGLALFENDVTLNKLLVQANKTSEVSTWIGRELEAILPGSGHCSVLAIAYRINQTTVGSVGILGPLRIPYRQLFGILQAFSTIVSEQLTRSIYKFKIQFRQPSHHLLHLNSEEFKLIAQIQQ